jgi:hypothetical protein
LRLRIIFNSLHPSPNLSPQGEELERGDSFVPAALLEFAESNKSKQLLNNVAIVEVHK